MEPAVEAFSDPVELSFSLLGGLSVRSRDAAIQLPTRKAQALLAYLALRPGTPSERDKLHALLWPESGKAQAQASLRQLLLTVRGALSPHSHGALRSSRSCVELDAECVHVDVHALERCVAAGTRESLERAAALCVGPLLDGFVIDEAPFDEWVAFERARLQELMLGALEKLVELQLATGQVQLAIQTLRQALRIEPLQERSHRSLMRLYAMDGRRAEALQQYETCAALFSRELGVEPEEQTRRIARELREEPKVSGLSPALTLALAPEQPSPATLPPPIIGRQLELCQLEQARDQAWAGSGPLVLLSGDAGVGKTRLLEAVATHALLQGGISLRGRCFESEQVLPFALWVDLLRSDPACIGDALRQLPPTTRAEVARIVPALAETTAAAARHANDVSALFEAVRQLLELVAQRAPLLLVLEDLHWADAMSLRLLSFLARHAASSSRVCLMATVRAEERGESTSLRMVLHELEREQRLLEVSVVPLSRADTYALVRSLAPHGSAATDPVLDQIWAISEGNPLVVVEALHGQEQGTIAPEVARLPVPLRVRELIVNYVARLDRAGQEALAVAAVIGRAFDFALLLQVCGNDARELATTIEELVRKRLLQASGEGFYFTHDRIREVVFENLLPLRRKLLHGLIARALERLHSDRLDEESGTIGYHFARAGDAEGSVHHLLQFARRCSRNCGVEEALAALDEVQRQCARLPPAARDDVTVKVAVNRAGCMFYMGRFAEIGPALAPHLTTLERLNDLALTTHFHTLMAYAQAPIGEGPVTDEYDRRLLAAVSQSPDAGTAGMALSQLSRNALRTGRFELGIAQAIEAVAKLDAGDDPEFSAFAWITLGANHVNAGHVLAALDAFSQAVALSERTSAVRGQTIGLATVGMVRCTMLGEIDAGLESCRRAVQLAPDPYSGFYAHMFLVRAVALVASLPGGAARPSVLDDSFHTSKAVLERYAAESLDPVWSADTLLALCEAELASNNLAQAAQYAQRVLHATTPDGDPLMIAQGLSLLGRVELALGQLESSRSRLGEALVRFDAIDAKFYVAGARFGLAETAMAQGDHIAAATYLAQAATSFTALGSPFWSSLVTQVAREHASAL